MSDEEKKIAAAKRHRSAAHAMQSGVAMEMNYNEAPTSPKHLRVGINTALVDHGSLVALLIRKGVFTELEYVEAVADGMEEEKRRYEKVLSDRHGRKVTLA